MEIYLFPGYVSLDTARHYSPKLFGLLDELGVELEPVKWNGIARFIPEGEPVIVRASTMMQDSWKVVGSRCAQLGHFCFHDNAYVNADGDFERRALLDKAREFFSNLK